MEMAQIILECNNKTIEIVGAHIVCLRPRKGLLLWIFREIPLKNKQKYSNDVGATDVGTTPLHLMDFAISCSSNVCAMD